MIMINNTHVGKNIQDFKILKKIGSGGYATVYKAVSLVPGYEDFPVAIKTIEKRYIKKKNLEKRVRDEIRIHSVLFHPSIVKFYASFEDDKFVYLVLELCEGGSLEEYLKKNGSMPEREACYFIKQLIDGVTYLHKTKSILHRDLSLKNVLLTYDKDIKIADFGMASELKYPDEQKHTILGTPNYISPEVTSFGSYGLKLDCWAVGCVLFALLYGSLPFKGTTFSEIMKNTVTLPLLFPPNASNEARELLENLLLKNPEDRINIQDSLKYSFFQKFDKSYSKNSQRNEDSGLSSFSSSNSSHKSQRVSHNKPTSRRYDSNDMLNECANCVPMDNQRFHISRNAAFHESQQKIQRQERSVKGLASINHLKNKLPTLPSKQPLHQHIPHQNNFECDQTENRVEKELYNKYPPYYNGNRCESQIEDFPVENRYNSPLPYPSHRLQNIVEDHLYSNSYHSIHKNELSPQQYQKYVSPTRFCSHEFHSTPDIHCSHEVGCYCRQNKNNHYQSQRSNEEKPNIVELIPEKNPPKTRPCSHEFCCAAENHCSHEQGCCCRQSMAQSNQLQGSNEERSKNVEFILEKNTKTRSCSHEFRCLPESPCSHGVGCCCRQNMARNNQYQLQRSNEEIPKDVELILEKNPKEENLESVVKQPLTTLRLLPRRFTIKNAIVHILSNGQVCLESLKEKRKIKFVNHVCYISGDGRKIHLFKPKKHLPPSEQPPPFPENSQDFDFETLPKCHWNRYQYAKKIIDIVRAKTPKITIYGRDAKCVMMENLPDPDYEVNFNSGCSITQINLRVTCKDQNGSTIDPTSDMLEVYSSMKKRCQELDICLKQLSECNSGDTYFPVVIGRRSSISLNRQDTNQSPFSHNSAAIKEAIYEMKPYESMNTGFASYHSGQNSLQQTVPLKNIHEFERYAKSAKR